MILSEYSPHAHKIIVDDASNVQIFDTNETDVTRELKTLGILVSKGAVPSSDLAFYIASFIDSAQIFDDLQAQVVLSNETELNVENNRVLAIQPISKQTTREARDILREKNAILIAYANYSDNKSLYWDELDKFNRLQDLFRLGLFVPTGLTGVVIDAVRYTEPTTVSSSIDMDGYFNSEDLEQSAVFKSSFVIVCSRWLQYREN